MKTTHNIVIEMLRADPGVSTQSIADAAGVSRQRIHQILRTLGLMPERPAPKGNASPEYRCWVNMIERCTKTGSKSYPYYGGRGIRVCQRWLDSYQHFIKDMGARPSNKHSLDRIDNSGNYTPINCRWATHSEQMANRRQWNKKLTAKEMAGALEAIRSGETSAVVAGRYGVSPSTISTAARSAGISNGRGPKRKMDKTKVVEAVKLLKGGKGAPFVAKKLGVSVVTLRKEVLEHTGGKKLWSVGPHAKR